MTNKWMCRGSLFVGLFVLGGTPSCKSGDGDSEPAGDGDGDSVAGTPPELPRPVSGTRLKQTWWQAGDSAIPQEIYDAELDAACQFIPAEDETLRCLPAGGSVVFADDDCTEALTLTYPDSGCGTNSAPTFAGTYTRPQNCDETQKYLIWQVEDPIDTPANTYILEAEGCVETAVDEAATYYEATAVALDTFVRGQHVLDERTDEVGVRFIHAEDGAWFPDALVKLETGEDCTVLDQGEGEDKTYHCVTGFGLSTPEGLGDFADDTCSERAAISFQRCATLEVLSSSEGDPLCPVKVLREAGEEFNTYYTQEADSCVEGDPEFRPEWTHYRMGDPATGLIDLQISPPVEGSRLQDRYFTLDGVPLQRLPNSYDTELGTECLALPLTSGEVVCSPQRILNTSGSSAEVFADDACTQALVPGSSPRCEETDFNYITIQSDDFCEPGASELYAAGDAFSSDTVYVKNGDACGPSATDPNTIWYGKNELLDPEETFALLTKVVDD